MRLVLLGAPGSGKGTQAQMISKKYGLPHVSTGDIFRHHIINKTPLGVRIKEIIDAGRLCPDDITEEIVKERLSRKDCENGYLLDGFPRDIAQAKILDGFSSPDKVIEIVVDHSVIEKRITGRRSCPDCNGTFHTDIIGDVTVCPVCGGTLFTRKDDNPAAVKERLSVYKEKTLPLEKYYDDQGKLFKVNGDLPVEEVFAEIEKVLI